MKYSLRSLMIVVTLGPALLAFYYSLATRDEDWDLKDSAVGIAAVVAICFWLMVYASSTRQLP